MEQFEYLTILLEASTRFVEKQDKHTPTFSPKYLKPQLDELGKEGWELVSVQPVYTGRRQDILLFRWPGLFDGLFTHNYLCAFKRRVRTPTP